jgi:hypothetical protein
MKLRSRLAAAAGGLAIVAGIAVVPAASAAPANYPDQSAQLVIPEAQQGEYWWLNGSNVLFAWNASQHATPFIAIYIKAQNAYQLQPATGPQTGNGTCLFQDGTSYDIRSTVPCSTTKASGLWIIPLNGGQTWSLATTIYGWQRNQCATWQNFNARLLAQTCDQYSVFDNYQWIDQYQG